MSSQLGSLKKEHLSAETLEAICLKELNTVKIIIQITYNRKIACCKLSRASPCSKMYELFAKSIAEIAHRFHIPVKQIESDDEI